MNVFCKLKRIFHAGTVEPVLQIMGDSDDELPTLIDTEESEDDDLEQEGGAKDNGNLILLIIFFNVHA